MEQLDPYVAAAKEIQTHNIDQGLWLRCWAKNEGDERKTAAAYIEQRARLIAHSQTIDRKSQEIAAQKERTRIANEESKRLRAKGLGALDVFLIVAVITAVIVLLLIGLFSK